eukprot:SAG31_NODE_28864_length_404_cov_0.865574_1_plen_39_part_01
MDAFAALGIGGGTLLQIRRSDMPKPLAHGDGFHGGKVSP